MSEEFIVVNILGLIEVVSTNITMFIFNKTDIDKKYKNRNREKLKKILKFVA